MGQKVQCTDACGRWCTRDGETIISVRYRYWKMLSIIHDNTLWRWSKVMPERQQSTTSKIKRSTHRHLWVWEARSKAEESPTPGNQEVPWGQARTWLLWVHPWLDKAQLKNGFQSLQKNLWISAMLWKMAHRSRD